jgi:hypothetical protein
MSDLVNRLTFGFLMAQLVPGIIVVFSVAFLYVGLRESDLASVSAVASFTLDAWGESESLAFQILFVFLSIGAGMTLHGVHWGVLGYLEEYFNETNDEGRVTRQGTAYNAFWNDFPIAVQILLGPVKLVIEFLGFLFRTRDLESVIIEENLPEIAKSEAQIEAFKFLEEFYLHFAQFYAHTSYAFTVSFFSLLLYALATCFTSYRVILLMVLYLLTGVFFVVSRLQFGSLFRAEAGLAGRPPGSRAA